MKIIARETSVDHFNTTDLDDAMPFVRIDTCRFGIEDNLTLCHETRSVALFAIEYTAKIQVGSLMRKSVEIFTDGSCLGNPGPGGYGALLRYKNHVKELSGGFALTTNNRMELMAAIVALECLKEACDINLTTDSQYVRQGITQWLHGWKRNNWRTAAKEPVKNQDLWQRLDTACQRHQVSWHWVKGHAGHDENERCDQLARSAAEQQDLPPDSGFTPAN